MDVFSKKPTTIEQQISILQERGMIISDKSRAKEFLEYCSYYRFCGYALHFEELTSEGERTHRYKPNTTFEAVEKLYHFDSALRRLIFHYTTLIEVDFRTTLGNESAVYFNDAHWFIDPENFTKAEQHHDFLSLCSKEVENSREIFISSYKKKYSNPSLPPLWMLTELMSFSVWSRLYQNLADKNLKKVIADKQKIKPHYLESWLKALTVLRNHCAHHSRIWNRNFTQAPSLSERMKKKIIPGQHKKIFVLLLIIYELLRKIKRENDFYNDLTALFREYPEIDLKNLGFADSPELCFFEKF